MRRIAAAAGALAVGLMGLAGASMAATATEVTGVGNIDPNQKSTLTINKFDGAQGTEGDGTKQDVSGFGNPLSGVEFTITPVTDKGDQAINLDTPEGWDLINGVTAKDVIAPTYKFGDVTKITTDKDGIASSELPHGLYLVTETGHGANNIVSETAPFLVTLPLPTTKGNWLYDVNVYPKNQVLGAPEKTINKTEDQKGVKVGDTVEYTIKQTVPRLNEGEKYTQAVIYDVLDSSELAYNATTSVTLNGTALDAGDYTIAADGSSWTLTNSGLAKIKAGDTLEVIFTAKVQKVTETGGIENGPGNGEPGQPGYGSTFNGTTTPGNTTPYTYWGQLNVTKTDENGHNLKDAEFAVTAAANDGSCPATVTGDTVATGKSDSNGIVQWNDVTPASPLGLFIANSSDGAIEPAPSKNYCLYETKAPAGYIAGTFDPTVTITAGTKSVKAVNVENKQQNHPNLPLTGAAGTVVMTLGGIALVLAGGAAYAIARKRSIR